MVIYNLSSEVSVPLLLYFITEAITHTHPDSRGGSTTPLLNGRNFEVLEAV